MARAAIGTAGARGDGDGEAQAAVLQAPTWGQATAAARVMTRSPAARSVDRSAAATPRLLPPAGRPARAASRQVAPWMSLHTRAGAQADYLGQSGDPRARASACHAGVPPLT